MDFTSLITDLSPVILRLLFPQGSGTAYCCILGLLLMLQFAKLKNSLQAKEHLVQCQISKLAYTESCVCVCMCPHILRSGTHLTCGKCRKKHNWACWAVKLNVMTMNKGQRSQPWAQTFAPHVGFMVLKTLVLVKEGLF